MVRKACPIISVGRILSALSFASLAAGLAPTLCAQDVKKYVADIVEYGSSFVSGGLTTCACIYDAATGFTPLHEVANRGGVRAGIAIVTMLGSHANVLEVDKSGATALHVAASRGDIHAGVALIDAAKAIGYLSNLLFIYDKSGETALDKAEEAEHIAMARVLVQFGAKRGIRSGGSNVCASPVADAVLLDDFVALGYALNAPRAHQNGSVEVDCFYPPAYHQKTLLHIAIAMSDLLPSPSGLAIVESLLSRRANAARADGSGQFPLARATRNNRVNILLALLGSMRAEEINLQDPHGRTALHEASRAGAQQTAIALMASGANVNIRDSVGLTPLDYAHNQGHPHLVSAIAMIMSLPPSQLYVPGNIMGISDLPEMPTNADGSNVLAILGVVLGVVLGMLAALVIGIAFRRYQQSFGSKVVDSLPEALREERGDSLKKSVKRPKSLEHISNKALVPPGQIVGSDSSDGEDVVSKLKSPQSGAVVLQAQGKQSGARDVLKIESRCPQGHTMSAYRCPSTDVSACFRCDKCDQIQDLGATMHGCRACNYDLCAICVASAPSSSRPLSDSDVNPPHEQRLQTTGKPMKDRDTVSLPPSPMRRTTNQSRIAHVANLQNESSEQRLKGQVWEGKRSAFDKNSLLNKETIPESPASSSSAVSDTKLKMGEREASTTKIELPRNITDFSVSSTFKPSSGPLRTAGAPSSPENAALLSPSIGMHLPSALAFTPEKTPQKELEKGIDTERSPTPKMRSRSRQKASPAREAVL